MAFHNVIFPEDYSQGAVGGPEFRTTVVVTGSGYEQRNVDWDAARLRFDLSRLLYDESTRKGTISFFRARRGKAHSFLFKDWGDYYIGMTWNPTTKVLDHTASHDIAEGDGVETVFDLYVIYDSGGAEEARRITRPKSAIKVYLDGVEQVSGYSVSYTTGQITFSVAPGAGVDIGWSGEFYVPCRFDVDHLQINYLNPTTGDVTLPVVEVRE